MKAAQVVPASGGNVLIQVSPSKIVTGKRETARIDAVFPEGASDIVFFASLGRTGKVEMLSATSAKAEYEVPESYVPQIDIVTAMATVDGHRIWGFATVLLYWQGEAEIKTRANAEAYITIGGEVFGPEIADRKGKAVINVEIPPGIEFGEDERGKAVDLEVPITARTAVFSATKRIPIGKMDEVDLFAVVANRDGSLDPDSPITITADRGRVVDVNPNGDGSFTAHYLPPSEYKGPVLIQAVVPGDDAPPAELALELADPSTVFENLDMGSESKDRAHEDGLNYNIFSTIKIGFAWDLPVIAALSLGADAGASLMLGKEKFALGLDLGFSLSSKSDTVVVNDFTPDEIEFDTDVTTMIFPVAATLGWHRTFSKKFGLWVLGQGGVAVVNNKIHTTSDEAGVQYQRTVETLGLLGIGTALEWSAGPGDLVAEFRWLWYPGKVNSFNGVLNSLHVDLGYRFWFL